MSRLSRIAWIASFWLVAANALAYAAASDISRRAGFIQRLHESVPAALPFHDETGHDVRLSDYLGHSPLVLVFAWYGCRTLCPTVVGNLAHALAESNLAPGDYQVVVASIDPRDSPADAQRMKRAYLADAGANGRSWHLLTGSATSIAALTDAVGFRYAYDETSHQYAHPAGIVLVTPRGTIARYFFGFAFTPVELRAAVGDASADRIASPVDRLLLLCFHFTPAGRYGALIMDGLRGASVLLLVAAGALFVVLRRRADSPQAPT